MENLITIVVTALLTTVGTYLVTRYEAATSAAQRQDDFDRQARYLAIRVVCELEPFITKCVDVAFDSGVEASDGTKEPLCPTPTITLPQDVDWQSISADLMYRTLGFPNAVSVAQQAVKWTAAEVAAPPDYEELFHERRIRYGRLGIMAVELSDDLRRSYRLPPREKAPNPNWDPIAALSEQVTLVEQERAEFTANSVFEAMKKNFENLADNP